MEFVKPPEHPRVNTLLYGPPKTGKSAGAGSAPGGVLYLNCDLPNATRFVHRRNPDGRIMEISIPPYEEGKHPVFDLMAEIARTVGDPSQKLVDSVVVDPIGELHRRLMEEFSRRSIRPAINIYGDVTTHIERFCRFLCEADVNVVFVCHEQPVEDEAENMIERLPYTGTKNPALGQKILGMVDVVGYTGVIVQEGESPRYVAQLVPAKGRRGGDRFACLEGVADLDIADWVSTIEKSEKSEVKKSKQPETNQSTPQEVAA